MVYATSIWISPGTKIFSAVYPQSLGCRPKSILASLSLSFWLLPLEYFSFFFFFFSCVFSNLIQRQVLSHFFFSPQVRSTSALLLSQRSLPQRQTNILLLETLLKKANSKPVQLLPVPMRSKALSQHLLSSKLPLCAVPYEVTRV